MIRVEPLTKLIPCSSFADLLLLAHEPQAMEPDAEALIFSVSLAAVNALSEEEIIQRFNESIDTVNARFNSGIQAIFAHSKALQQPSTRILQALVLHAVCMNLDLCLRQLSNTKGADMLF
jgi:hypothetical protein